MQVQSDTYTRTKKICDEFFIDRVDSKTCLTVLIIGTAVHSGETHLETFIIPQKVLTIDKITQMYKVNDIPRVICLDVVSIYNKDLRARIDRLSQDYENKPIIPHFVLQPDGTYHPFTAKFKNKYEYANDGSGIRFEYEQKSDRKRVSWKLCLEDHTVAELRERLTEVLYS